jgi:hypothetical protein
MTIFSYFINIKYFSFESVINGMPIPSQILAYKQDLLRISNAILKLSGPLKQ